MAIYTGDGRYIGAGAESTYGTAVTRTAWIYVKSANLLKTPVFEAQQHLTGARGPLRTRKFQKRIDAGGQFSLIPDYSSKVFGLFLRAGLGSLATTGSGPYTHTFTIARALPALTVELGDLDKYEVFEGCQVSSWRFSCAAGEAANFEASLIAETSGGMTQPNSSYPTVSDLTYPILHNHAGTCSINGNSYTLRRFEIAGNNQLARVDQLGSHLTREPFSTAHREYTARVELYLESEVLEGDFQSGTETDMTITFTDSPRSLAFTLQNAYINARTLNADSVGGQILTLDLVGLDDGTDKGLKAILINAHASGV